MQFLILRAVIVINHIQGNHAILLLGILDHQGEIHQVLNRFRISYRNQNLLHRFLRSLIFGLRIFVQCKPAGGTFRYQRTDDTGEKDHHDRTVQYVIIEQTLSVFHDNFVPDQHRCQRSRRLCITESEDHAAFIGLHTVNLLRDPCSKPFAESSYHCHDYRHFQCFAPRKQASDIDNHTDTDQKVRNEQGISHKFQTVHQRRDMRNQAVQDQSGKESSQNSFHSYKLHQSASEENHRQHEHELHHAVVILPEKPATDAGEKEDDKETKEGYFRNEEHPEQTIDGAFKHSTNNGKDDKGKSDRNGRTTDSNIDTTQTGQSVTADNRISNQSVRSIHTGEQHCGKETVSQHAHTAPYTQRHRNQESKQAEDNALHPVFLEVLHVHFESGKEHDIVKPHFTKQFEAAVTVEHMESVFADQHTGQNHTDNMRYMKAPQNHRSKENDN